MGLKRFGHLLESDFVQTTITFFNNNSNFTVTNSQPRELVGGKKQEWKTIVNQIGQKLKKLTSPVTGEEKVKLDYDLTKIKRTDFPIILDPQTTSFTDVATHAFLRQRLGQHTIEKRLSTARYMETHTVPVNFRKPTIENFMAHMNTKNKSKTLEMDYSPMNRKPGGIRIIFLEKNGSIPQR